MAGVLSILTLSAYVLRLDHGELLEWDEAIYADAAQNVLDGHIIILRLTGDGHKLGSGIFLEKPPLVPWLQAISMGVFGQTPAAARIPSLLAFIGCVALVVYIGSETVSYRGGLIAGLLLIFSDAATGTHGPLYGSTDVILTLFGSVAVWMWVSYQRADDHENWQLYAAATALALAVLSKGVAAFVFVLVAVPALYWRIETLRSRRFWQAASLFALISAPWFIFAYAAVGDVFLEQFLFDQVVDRATGEMGVESSGLFPWMRYPYFVRWPQYMGLGLVSIVIAGTVYTLATSIANKKLSTRPIILHLILWAGIFPIFYALVGGNHIWYTFPSVIPLSVLGGWSIETLIQDDSLETSTFLTRIK